MRCPSCNKFVSYDEPQCEVNSVELGDDHIHVSVTVQLNCADCGDTLKDAEIESEAQVEHTCKPEAERKPEWQPDPDYKPAEGSANDEEQFEIESDRDPEGTSRLQTKDRNGKDIKSRRYMKSFYGFTIEPELKCRKCGESFSVTLAGEEQASGFNECC